jgi:hypothetical protein
MGVGGLVAPRNLTTESLSGSETVTAPLSCTIYEEVHLKYVICSCNSLKVYLKRDIHTILRLKKHLLSYCILYLGLKILVELRSSAVGTPDSYLGSPNFNPRPEDLVF